MFDGVNSEIFLNTQEKILTSIDSVLRLLMELIDKDSGFDRSGIIEGITNSKKEFTVLELTPGKIRLTEFINKYPFMSKTTLGDFTRLSDENKKLCGLEYFRNRIYLDEKKVISLMLDRKIPLSNQADRNFNCMISYHEPLIDMLKDIEEEKKRKIS